MSVSAKNTSKDKDTNGIHNPEAQPGLQKSGELSRPPSNAAVKQTTVRTSRAEQTPALQTLVRSELDAVWQGYEEQCKEDTEAIAGKDLYGLSLLSYADSLADQFITTELVSEASLLYAEGKGGKNRGWNTGEAKSRGMERIID